VIAADDRNRITYFINLIDILYDASVNLIILADAYFDEIYPEGALSFEYKRTKSRLQEMQSQEYLQQPHIV
jgi:cell division protein ZapE